MAGGPEQERRLGCAGWWLQVTALESEDCSCSITFYFCESYLTPWQITSPLLASVFLYIKWSWYSLSEAQDRQSTSSAWQSTTYINSQCVIAAIAINKRMMV